MMGHNIKSGGAYSDEDVAFSCNIDTYDERSKKDMEAAWRRIGELGVSGLAELYEKKIMTSYADGSFTWEGEGNVYAYDTYYFPIGFRWGYDHIPNFYIGEQFEDMVEWSCSNVFRIIEQCAWMAVLFLGIFAFSRRMNAGGATLLLALLGMLGFQLLFECKGRYEFGYVPVHILAAGLGIATLKDMFKKIRKSRKMEASPA